MPTAVSTVPTVPNVCQRCVLHDVSQCKIYRSKFAQNFQTKLTLLVNKVEEVKSAGARSGNVGGPGFTEIGGEQGPKIDDDNF